MKYIRLLCLFLTTIFLSACSFTTKEPIQRTGFYFDTVISITLYDTQDESLLDNCFAYCEEFENLISRTKPGSDIARINAAGGQPVTVSDTTIELLKLGIYYGNLTKGAFDITIAPVSSLWDFKSETNIVPSDAQIKQQASHVNYQNIHIDGNTVRLTDKLAALDLGGIAKGYMADQLKNYLKQNQVKSALINLGGNIATIGSKPDGSAFKIGIQKPFDTQNASITSVSSKNSSVVTSGVYERYFKVNNQLYHHILDPHSGYPCVNGLLSVTILSKDSTAGDALSTACFVLGPEQGQKLIQSLDGIDAIFITEDYQIIDTRHKKREP